MKKYFYSDGINKFGPFTIEEISDKGISRETLIWFHELGTWKKAGSIQELSSLFALIPPPIHKKNSISLNTPPETIDKIVLLIIILWLALETTTYIMYYHVGFEYAKSEIYFSFSRYLFFLFPPIVMAFSVRNNTLKNISISISIILFIYKAYNSITWLIGEIK
jgi:hypothetical protein